MDSSLKLCNVVLEKYYERPEELNTLFKMMLVLNGLLSFTAVLGNLSIIFGLKKASSIPSSTQILRKCLAVTDLGNGVVGHPLYLAVISGLRQSYTCENNHQILFLGCTDVTRNQTKKLSILLSFYFHEVLQYLNTFT